MYETPRCDTNNVDMNNICQLITCSLRTKKYQQLSHVILQMKWIETENDSKLSEALFYIISLDIFN